VLGHDGSHLGQVEDLADVFFENHDASEILGATSTALGTVDHDAIRVLDWFEAVSLITGLFAGATTPGRAILGDGGLANPSVDGRMEEFFELRPGSVSNSSTRVKRTATVACSRAISASF